MSVILHATMEDELAALLAVFDLPAANRVSLRATNLIERAFPESFAAGFGPSAPSRTVAQPTAFSMAR